MLHLKYYPERNKEAHYLKRLTGVTWYNKESKISRFLLHSRQILTINCYLIYVGRVIKIWRKKNEKSLRLRSFRSFHRIGGNLKKLGNIGKTKAGLLFIRLELIFNLRNQQKIESGQVLTLNTTKRVTWYKNE